jgi:putative ABC transport system permease protein
MVVSQFSLAMMLICGSMVLVEQIFYLKNKPLGFNHDQVVVIPFRNDFLINSFTSVKTELQKIPGVKEVTASSNIPGKQFNQHSIARIEDPENDVDASESYVDENLAKTLGLELVDGRFFIKDSKADSADAIIINESTARQLQLNDPIGKRLRIRRDGEYWERTIIGVLKDFHFQSLHTSIQPLIFFPIKRYNFALLKIDATQPESTLASIQKKWQEFYTGFGFEYFFLDETLNAQYKSEQRMSVVLIFFTVTGILITCMGLFGQAIVNFKVREKEVGVRKVLGSSTFGIQTLLLKDMGRLIFIALLIGSPLAYFMIQYYLQNFTYHVGINILNFVGAGLTIVIVSLLTISLLVRKTASLNPTQVLKSE